MGKRKPAAKAPPGTKRAKVVAIRGERVAQLRDAKGWSQPQLAYRSGMHPADISQIENNRRNIRGDKILKLILTLDCSADYLFGVTDDPKSRR